MTLRGEILEGLPLNDTEVEALRGAALGETAEQTGARVYLATETIKNARKCAFAKLGVSNTTRAVVVAIATGILNIADLVPETDA